MRRAAGRSVHAGLLFAVLGLLAWATGRPFVFPSLGPSAFVLATDRPGDRPRPARVVGGHAVGAVAGLLAYALLAGDASLAAVPPPRSPAGLRLAASGTLALALTSGGMVVTDTVHPPACATTLIVALGILSTPLGVATIVVSVVGLVGVDAVARRSRTDAAGTDRDR